ncbi:gamma-glutamyltransferase [Zhengella mangrovi]|uniref:Glutathione hydrolase proenzyme n=1 Tax=Zhengella mangrovi TaxID=1982044 RepID=A0A2G1QI04_9HYPH|nr:gamma-glutamyltransferase [Zhengella mangrovi]PHP65084.1 gamma-glutamyltransferase [Zhengella mangrovi]
MQGLGPRTLVLAILVSLLLPAMASAQQAADTVQPETATAPVLASPADPVRGKAPMVVAANPLAARAGMDALAAGGSAIDAMIAVQTVLGLVEPQSSGIGGGAFLVYYDAATGKLTTIDGRETAPAAATADLFRQPDGKPMNFFDAVVGGRSVGVPGVVALMDLAHKAHGKRPWADNFAAAIAMAETGFAVSPRLAGLIAADRQRLEGQPTTRAYFFDSGGEPLKAGAVLKNHDYAESLRSIAQAGARAFCAEAIADRIVDAIRLHATNPGLMTIDDMKAYRAVERAAVCAPYRGFEVCGMGPPSSGALTIGQILGLLQPFDLAALGPEDPQAWRLIGDATRLAFADRGRFMADSDFVSMPKGLLDAGYLRDRSEQLRRDTALPGDAVKPGNPPWDKAELRRDGIDVSMPSTSHFVIVDADGNVVSMTSSVENGFGARLMAGGFLLNNQLTDFSFLPESADGETVANRVEPGKRPRSSMSPTIILKDGKPAFALGSPGGSRIIPYVANAIVALLDWKMNIQQAVALPHLTNRFGTYDIEQGTSAEALVNDLQALGYETAVRDLNSGLHGVAFTEDGLEGGADPRREGVALAPSR